MKMREIKFRAWDKNDSKENIIEWDKLLENYKLDLLLTDANNHWEIMQFTGLKDKNGKEIYEGDILYVRQPRGKFVSKGKVIVEWKNCEFYARKFSKMIIEEEESLGNYRFKDYNIEVIGNIYENPDLIGGVEE